MDSRDYFENVLEHFLVVHENDNGHGFTISDLKLNKGSLKLDFRDAQEKALLDDINSLRFPLIEELDEEHETIRILPPQEKSKELTISFAESVLGLKNGIKSFGENVVLAVELDELKHAMSLGLTVLELHVVVYDFGLVKELAELQEIVSRKYQL